MTDEEREELLRWAAEDVLGGDFRHNLYRATVGKDVRETRTYNVLRPSMSFHENLTGWHGFGLAMEAAAERELSYVASSDPETRRDHIVTFFHTRTGQRAGDYEKRRSNADPGIAAWLALREALR